MFSRTLQAPDPAVEIVSADPVGRVRALKEEDGLGIWQVGGRALAGSLADEIGRLMVKLAPITLAAGIPLFGREGRFRPTTWRLVDSHVVPSGAPFLTYERDRGPGAA